MSLEPDLSRYVTDTNGDVYAILGIPEEILAVVFAYVSRSPKSFRENLLQVTAERAEQFHEKWVLHYGHASVAEHAAIHLGIERLSRYASAVLEDSRLISVTEYSQRYQAPGPGDLHLPRELDEGPAASLFRDACGQLYGIYTRLLDDLAQYLRGEMPRKEAEDEGAWMKRLRRRAFEDARYVLPLATTTSLGLTANAREMEHVISKCLSHPAAELQKLGNSMREACRHVAPTLIKYAAPLPYRRAVEERRAAELAGLAADLAAARTGASEHFALPPVELVDWTGRGEVPRGGEPAAVASERRALSLVLESFLAPDAMYPASVRTALERAGRDELAARFATLLGTPAQHESLPRELESVVYTFDLVLSEAAWHQLLRHRMMSAFPGSPRLDLGLRIPPLIETAALADRVRDAAVLAAGTVDRLGVATLPETARAVAPYLVTNAHLRRVRLVMNLRQLHHLTRLRMSAHAQWDIREVSAALIEAVRAVHPSLVSAAGSHDRS